MAGGIVHMQYGPQIVRILNNFPSIFFIMIFFAFVSFFYLIFHSDEDVDIIVSLVFESFMIFF